MLTGREMDVMSVLWKRGSGTVSEVKEDLADELAYTTILTILRRLEKKGHVSHVAEGKAHRYLPLLAREDAQDHAIRRMTRSFFSNSPELLMTRLLRRGELTDDQLRELRDLVDRRLGKGGQE